MEAMREAAVRCNVLVFVFQCFSLQACERSKRAGNVCLHCMCVCVCVCVYGSVFELEREEQRIFQYFTKPEHLKFSG